MHVIGWLCLTCMVWRGSWLGLKACAKPRIGIAIPWRLLGWGCTNWLVVLWRSMLWMHLCLGGRHASRGCCHW